MSEQQLEIKNTSKRMLNLNAAGCKPISLKPGEAKLWKTSSEYKPYSKAINAMRLEGHLEVKGAEADKQKAEQAEEGEINILQAQPQADDSQDHEKPAEEPQQSAEVEPQPARMEDKDKAELPKEMDFRGMKKEDLMDLAKKRGYGEEELKSAKKKDLVDLLEYERAADKRKNA